MSEPTRAAAARAWGMCREGTAAWLGAFLGAVLFLGAGCGAASLRHDAGPGSDGAADGAGGAATIDSGAGGSTDTAADRVASVDTPPVDAPPDTAPPDAPPPDTAPDGGNCARPRSCAALHTCSPSTPTGSAMIFPDGAADAGLQVHCDMDTAGGGWTVIFLADSVNLNSTAIPYTVPNQSLRDGAQQAMMSFRNLNLNMLASDWATFDLPASWRTKNPLAASPVEDLTVSASVNGSLPGPALLRYGQANFGALCGDPWSTTAGDLYGRICLQGTAAAFYSGFTIATADYCSLSTQSYATQPCSDTARFSIAVR